MATENPYADKNGNPLPGQTMDWVAWKQENPEDSDLSESKHDQLEKLQARMDAERFPV